MIELIVALAIPLVIVACLRRLSQRWFPWVMRPLEKALSRCVRTVWGLVWTQPARAWGGCNVLWFWSLAGAVFLTIGAVLNGRGDWLGLGVLWGCVALAWWALWTWNRWRLRPRRLPHRRRRGG